MVLNLVNLVDLKDCWSCWSPQYGVSFETSPCCRNLAEMQLFGTGVLYQHLDHLSESRAESPTDCWYSHTQSTLFVCQIAPWYHLVTYTKPRDDQSKLQHPKVCTPPCHCILSLRLVEFSEQSFEGVVTQHFPGNNCERKEVQMSLSPMVTLHPLWMSNSTTSTSVQLKLVFDSVRRFLCTGKNTGATVHSMTNGIGYSTMHEFMDKSISVIQV